MSRVRRRGPPHGAMSAMLGRGYELTLVLYYRPANAHSLNAVAGALETAQRPAGLEVVCADDLPAVVAACGRALGRGREVVVGWSFLSLEFADCRAELQAVRQQAADPRVSHLAGGAHASAEPELTLRAGFDCVAIGEGERTIVQFLGRLLRKEDPAGTRGIACARNGHMISAGPGERIDLDDYPPFAARCGGCHPAELEQDAAGEETRAPAARQGRFNPIELTRGCVYACRFCQTPFLFGARFRHRSVENVCHYVGVMKQHGLFDVRFTTPSALSYGAAGKTVRLDKIEELLASVRQRLGDKGRIFFGTFPSEVRPEHLTPAALRVLKRWVANDNLVIGGQSGSDRLLKAAGRGHSVEAIVAAACLAREAGFLPNVDLIFGLPGETPDDTAATLRLAEQLAGLGARIHGHAFMPLPGTPWRDAPPPRLCPATLRQLGRLAASGKLYGQWRRQLAPPSAATAPSPPQWALSHSAREQSHLRHASQPEAAPLAPRASAHR